MSLTFADVTVRFSALAHSRRRSVLACLTRHRTVALADLADELAVDEYDTTLPEIPADAVTDIYLELYHCHIPKLADANFVQYDQDHDLVTLTERGHTAHEWLADHGADASSQTRRSAL